mgnify:CR=1 FL=1
MGLSVERSRAALDRQIKSEVSRLCGDARTRPVLVVDEAHGSGVYGPGGSGLIAELGLRDAVDVSVVLLTYNHERFLAQAIESILAQTFEAFELLLVDDGSTDGRVASISASGTGTSSRIL